MPAEAKVIIFSCLLVFGGPDWWANEATVNAQTATQGRHNLRQLQLIVDNDAYFFTAYDRYYSSGIFASYGQVLNSPLVTAKNRTAGTKYTAEVWFSHYIYTPKNILWQQEDQIDRPYAGLATIGARLNYLRKRAAFSLRADVGWLGPAIKTEELHRWWHKTLNIRLPRGWEFQVNNSPAVIIVPEFTRRWVLWPRADVLSTSGLMAGTVFNRLSQGATVRVGLPRPLDQSHVADGLLGVGQEERGLWEWYLLASLQLSYVVYDATIEGNMMGQESEFTKVSEPWVLRHTYGVVVAGARTDFELSFKLTSREVVGAEQHRYMRAKVSYRF